jgi:Rel/ankyrin family protein
MAIVQHRLVIIQKLLESGANPNWCDYNGNTALHRAIQEGSRESIKKIFDIAGQKVKIDVSNDDGFSALHLAVRYKNLEIVKYLINNGASFRTRDMKHGNNILHMAIENVSLFH